MNIHLHVVIFFYNLSLNKHRWLSFRSYPMPHAPLASEYFNTF